MTLESSFVVSAIEMCTPVGHTVDQSAAAIRAGVSGLRVYDDYVPINENDGNEEGASINAGFVPDLRGRGVERLVNLVEKPLSTVILNSGFKPADLARGDLLMALPDLHPATESLKLKQSLSNLIPKVFELPPFRHVTGIEQGQSGTISMIARGCRAMMESEVDFVIVLAVDSFMLDGRLNEYDRAWRIKSERCPTGFSPGEASVALLIERYRTAENRGIEPYVKIERTGFSTEPNTIHGDKSSSSVGLTSAIRGAHGNSDRPIEWIYSDLNGESYPGYEWGITRVRNTEIFYEDMAHVHSADVTGHIGAATTAVQIGCLVEGYKKEYAASETAMLIAGSDGGRRAALRVSSVSARD